MQPFIPREGVYRKNKTKNIRGTIKDNYDEPESEEEGSFSILLGTISKPAG